MRITHRVVENKAPAGELWVPHLEFHRSFDTYQVYGKQLYIFGVWTGWGLDPQLSRGPHTLVTEHIYVSTVVFLAPAGVLRHSVLMAYREVGWEGHFTAGDIGNWVF